MISGIRGGNSDLAAIKGEYMEAQRKGDVAAMNKAKQKAMQLRNNSDNQLIHHIDTVQISKEGMNLLKDSQNT
jgi:hypothetical protein